MTHLDAAFGALRSHLATPNTRTGWGTRLHHLCARAHALDPQIYTEAWLPYLDEAAKDFPSPLLTLRSVEDLRGAAALMPMVWFGLELDRWVRGDAIAELASSPAFAQVRDLNLADVRIDHDVLDVLLDSPYATGLTKLSTRFVGVDYLFVRKLAASRIGSTLTYLSVDDAVGDDGIRAIATLGFPNLTHLDVKRAKVSMRGLDVLVASDLMPRLKHLDLSGNTELGGALYRIKSSATLAGLEKLRLSCIGFTPVDLRAVCTSPHLAGLSSLDISYQRLDDACVRALTAGARSGAMRELVLADTGLLALRS